MDTSAEPTELQREMDVNDSRMSNTSTKSRTQLSHQSSLASSSGTPRAKGGKHFTFSEAVSNTPSLEASLDISTVSTASDERLGKSKRKHFGFFGKSRQTPATANKPQSPKDDTCVTDRVVRFFCPFDTISETKPQASGSRRQGATGSGRLSRSQGEGPYIGQCDNYGANEDCSRDWLQPICIPNKWNNSPERKNLVDTRLEVRNRCSTLDPNKRKPEYINQIRKQWHSSGKDTSSSAHVTLRTSRSDSVHQKKRTPLNPDALYYDSDPEVPTSTPKYKRNRPPPLNLTLDTANEEDNADLSEFECPRVPRHSTQELQTFFESPRSVAEAPDFDNDEEIRAFINVSIWKTVNVQNLVMCSNDFRCLNVEYV